MSKIYDNLDSTAIKSIVVDQNTVKIVYKSNTSKEYSYNCTDINTFRFNLENIIDQKAKGFFKHSVGSYVNQKIKEEMLVESK